MFVNGLPVIGDSNGITLDDLAMANLGFDQGFAKEEGRWVDLEEFACEEPDSEEDEESDFDDELDEADIDLANEAYTEDRDSRSTWEDYADSHWDLRDDDHADVGGYANGRFVLMSDASESQGSDWHDYREYTDTHSWKTARRNGGQWGRHM
jgi:hypothetical protein